MHQEDLAWFSLSVHFSITVFANWNYKYLKYSYLYIDKTKCGKCEIQQMTKFKLFGLLEKKFKLFGLLEKKFGPNKSGGLALSLSQVICK